MQARLDSAGLLLAFPTAEDAQTFLAGVRANSGFLIPLERQLALFEIFSVTIEIGGLRHEAFRCFVARVSTDSDGAFETAFVVEDWNEAAKPGERPASADATEITSRPESEMRGVAAVHRIRDMNMGQKTILAQRAGRAERQVLLRDNAPQVLQALLANPRVEPKEILQIAKSTYASGAILQRIGGDSRWGKNQEILTALVRNPKTPTILATRLVDKLRTSDLRQMAKMSSGLKEMLRKAALREYLKRSGR